MGWPNNIAGHPSPKNGVAVATLAPPAPTPMPADMEPYGPHMGPTSRALSNRYSPNVGYMWGFKWDRFGSHMGASDGAGRQNPHSTHISSPSRTHLGPTWACWLGRVCRQVVPMWVPAGLANWDPYGDKMGQLLTMACRYGTTWVPHGSNNEPT